MNKKYLFSTALCALLTITSACSNDELAEEQTNGNQITMTASDFEYADGSRTSIDITSGGGTFNWAENDTVGIFPDKGHQVDFPMVSGAGTKTASFNGGGWALKSSSTYAAYYPFIGQTYLDKTSIPVDYDGQYQEGNASTSHLGQYDYMAAIATTPRNGTVNFHFKHLGCLVELTVLVPVKGFLSSVKFTSGNNIFIHNGYMDITTTNPSIHAYWESNTFSLNTNITTTSDNTPVTLYFMMPPLQLENNSLKVELSLNDYIYTGQLNISKMEAGKAYKYSVTTFEFDYDSLNNFQKAKGILKGDIVLNTHFTMNGVSKSLLPQGCPTKFNFSWNKEGQMHIELNNFHIGTMPMQISFCCATKFMSLNGWEKDEYKGDGWIKFIGKDGKVTSVDINQSNTQESSGATVLGYLNVKTLETEFIINYNMMNVRSECFLQTIDKSRINRFEQEFAQYEKDLAKYKEEHGL